MPSRQIFAMSFRIVGDSMQRSHQRPLACAAIDGFRVITISALAETSKTFDQALRFTCFLIQLMTIGSLHTDEAISSLQALHALGVKFALGDFGKGGSNQSYLGRLWVDALKIK